MGFTRIFAICQKDVDVLYWLVVGVFVDRDQCFSFPSCDLKKKKTHIGACKLELVVVSAVKGVRQHDASVGKRGIKIL